jgi:AcrR family transcriptional regulator
MARPDIQPFRGNSMSSSRIRSTPPSKVAILEAAEELFTERGYRDTTMVDIATLAGMSPANLYRHFANKEDIAAACGQRLLERKYQAARAALEQTHLTAAGRLEEFILALLRYTYAQTESNPTMNRMIEVVIASRPEVVHEMSSTLQSMIAEILAQGNAQREFAVEDFTATAETVFTAIAAFYTPLFMHLYPLPEFERRARATAALLVQGLGRR